MKEQRKSTERTKTIRAKGKEEMNKYDFYFPNKGLIDGKEIVIQPYEFRNYLVQCIRLVDQRWMFWSEVEHGDGHNCFHLTVVVDSTLDPSMLVTLINEVTRYAKEFQTAPIMWNDQENCGILSKDD